MKTSAALLPALLVLPLIALAQDASNNPRVAVVPFAALSGDLPARAGTKAAGLLTTELRSAEKFQLVDAKKAAVADPYQDELDEARRLVDEAKELRASRKFNAAGEALQKAIAKYTEGAGGIAKIDELQDAYTLLAAIQYLTGRDEEGEKTLQQAMSVAPDRDPPLAATSPLFSRVVKATREAVKKAPKGTLVVESSPQGATVVVDGIELGQSPLRVTDLPPGKHLWRVLLPSGEAVGGLAAVEPRNNAKVMGQAKADDPESKMLASLTLNKIDQAVVEAAKAHAQAVNADLLIFGALSREGEKNLSLDSFVLKVDSGELKRLPRSTFDRELLSAGLEFYNLVGRLAKEGLKVGSDVRLGGRVREDVMSSGIKLTDASIVKPVAACVGIDCIDTSGPADRGNTGADKSGPVAPKKRAPLTRQKQ